MLLLAGCSGGQAEDMAVAKDDGKVACRPAGAATFERVCLLDRTAGADGLELTIHHPDGAFRRLLVTRDGRGVVAADGAETAKVTITGDNEIEVAVGGDRYRLPATVKPPAS